MLVIGHVGQMMHVADVNHYLRNNAFNIRGRLAQLCRAWLNEILYNLFLFMAIISNFSDYNFVGAFSQELLTKKIQQAQVINTDQITLYQILSIPYGAFYNEVLIAIKIQGLLEHNNSHK